MSEVHQFKCLGSTQAKDETSLQEDNIRLTQAHSPMTRLATLWKTKSIFVQGLSSTNHSSILLHGCDSCTLTADLERRIIALENRCYRRMHCRQNERVCMATGQYSRRTCRNFSCQRYRQASQVIVVRPCLPSRYAVKNHTTGYSRWQSSQRKAA